MTNVVCGEICLIIQSSPLCQPSSYVSLIFQSEFSIVQFSSSLSSTTEQEPTLADPDSDEEADLVLSLETETGLLTNQHTKGKGGN
jgi:hypothetical protein